MSLPLRSFALATAAALAACVSDPSLPAARVAFEPVSPPASSAPFGLGAGDVVRVDVLGHPELSTPAFGTRITPSGNLDVPLIGPVHAGGLQPEELGAEIRERLGAFYREPHVSVAVVESGARHYFVLGSVDNPGEYDLDRPLNALQALSRAGSFEKGADRSEVILLRGGPDDLSVLAFDAETPGPSAFTTVLPDDVLLVQRRGTRIFEERVLPLLQGLSGAANVGSFATLLAAELED